MTDNHHGGSLLQRGQQMKFNPRTTTWQSAQAEEKTMPGVNWRNIGTNISGLQTLLTNAGVSAANLPTVLSGIGGIFGSSNPNKAEELSICGQMLTFANNPDVEKTLAMKLATEQGMPAGAASLALTLAQPGVDIPTRVMQIEQLIQQG